MNNMFSGATSFDQPLGSWNVASVTNMSSMFTGDKLSVQNYDNLLLGWSKLTLQSNITLDAGNSQYTSLATTARQSIITTYKWTITDGGLYAGVPTAPQSLQAQPNNSFVLLSWSLPYTIGGSSITSYSLYRSASRSTGYQLIQTFSNTTFSFNDTGLTNGQIYYYKISATNSIGTGPNSTVISSTPATIPYAPLSLQGQPSNTFVVLSWSVPSFNGGSAITSYNIYISSNGGTTFNFITSVSSSPRSFNETGLINGQTYYFEISASNHFGTGPNSTIINVTPATDLLNINPC